MPRYPEAFLLSLLLVGCSVHIGSSQCEKLPNDTVLEGLISSTFQGGDASISPNITVLEVNYVCLASGNVRGSFSGFSAVVLYECVGERCPASNVSQFEFSCDSIERKWINFVDGSTENLRTDVADANLTSPNRTDCSICFSPTHILANQLTPDMMSKYDNINHCLGCDEACNEGDMKCYDFDSNSCCNFYNLSGGCVAACSADSQPNENFVCTGGVVSLSMSEYVFSEESGSGNVSVEGPAGFNVRVVAVPTFDLEGVQPSGIVINTTVVTPATVLFNITDDDVAFEVDEKYTVTIIPEDGTITVGMGTATIIITDDIDTVQVGFESSEYILEEGNMTGVRVQVNGESIRDFSLFFIQEGEPQQMLTVMAGEQDILFPTIINPDDEIALQDDRTIRLGLLPLEEFEDRIIVGGQSKTDQQTFAEANVTIVDNDVVTLGIDGATSRSLFEGDSTDVCVSKDTVTARVVNFLLTALPGSAGPEDFSPITVQNGQLQGSSTSPVCFPFSAVEDSLSDDGESFSVALSSGDSFPTGPGGLQIGSDRVGVTILERIDVEDTVIGDPLFTVPLPASAGHLCYEIRGVADQFFNFISDECVSVNAHYSEHSPLPGETRQLHVIDQIAIRAVDNADDCIDILVDRNGCVTTANSETVSDTYNKEGVTVSAADNIVVVGVPNCGDLDLEMEVVCETRNGVEMIRFEVMRGHNLRDTSHGLLGQFWNVSISTQEFTGELRNTPLTGNLVLVTLVSPTSVRRFPAWQERKTWDNRRTCLFGGNQNGGTVYEVASNHDSLIQGDYTDYRTESEFSTQFKFSQFDNSRCS